jgi:hypothetical protein
LLGHPFPNPSTAPPSMNQHEIRHESSPKA